VYCVLCQSGNQVEFTAEIMIHFSGNENIDHPGIPAFPKISVCLDCGSSQFIVSEVELTRLAKRVTTRYRQTPLRRGLGMSHLAEMIN